MREKQRLRAVFRYWSGTGARITLCELPVELGVSCATMIRMTILMRVGLSALLIANIVPFITYAADVTVNMTDTAFEAKHITIYKNDKVIWNNTSNSQHTVTSDTGIFNSGQIVPNQSYWRTFPQTGVFPYYSASQGAPNGVGMSGTVSVIESATAAVATGGTDAPVLATGASASAATLQAQIADLLARISLLQQQYSGGTVNINTSGGSVTNTSSAGSLGGGQCPQASRTLKRGSSGDDVSRLQAFLARDSSLYPEGLVTGYYGALTEIAVQKFQCKNNIVCSGTPDSTGYGVTGPRTAALLALQCTGGSSGSGTGTGGSTGNSSANVGGFIRVTPVSGVAPLSIAVEANLNTTRSCSASSFQVDFGDGTAPAALSVPANTCAESIQHLTHIYAAPGTYNIKLRTGIHETQAQVVVTGGNAGDSISGTPGSGASPLKVTFKGTINSAGVCNAGPYALVFGDGETAPLQISGCSANSFTVTHVYTAQGNFTARLTRGSESVGTVPVSVFTTGTNTGTNTTTGSGSGGTVNLTAGASGNPATIQASFTLPSSCARFTLDWGDGTTVLTQDEGSCTASQVTKTYTHTYGSTGTYVFMLKRGASLQYTDSASITISN